MKTDSMLRADVSDELEWDPSVNTTDIGVAVKDGIVTLTGTVDSYTKKCAVEEAVQRVSGVRAVANDVQVKVPGDSRYSDEDIARAAANALAWDAILPLNLRVLLDDGWVTLSGEVDFQFQKRSAETVVRRLKGVRGISNNITVTSQVTPAAVKEKIEAALQRHASLDAKAIKVKVDEGKVELKGTVHSYAEKMDAEDAAWSAPGVTEVEDKLLIEY